MSFLIGRVFFRPFINQLARVHRLPRCISGPFKFPFPYRTYSHGPPMTKPMIEDRVMLVLRLYDKVNPEKLTLTSDFAKDFGLDSLDHVELVMAMEEEFNFEIPDTDSERFRTPGDIIRYICDKYDIYD
ncbi:hypothetical protein EG68_11415 [Paragonimus skrjabini miyazakii]|uniref:Acyl carrier protein n=1 Tax=Paragonimus skrjabini miyazakii TaxID=59628 RepID=A0A8S9YC01_9TREM|nr:hypothetical protein EG68_11415 [Paragonimus skrjabini miyazakii]